MKKMFKILITIVITLLLSINSQYEAKIVNGCSGTAVVGANASGCGNCTHSYTCTVNVDFNKITSELLCKPVVNDNIIDDKKYYTSFPSFVDFEGRRVNSTKADKIEGIVYNISTDSINNGKCPNNFYVKINTYFAHPVAEFSTDVAVFTYKKSEITITETKFDGSKEIKLTPFGEAAKPVCDANLITDTQSVYDINYRKIEDKKIGYTGTNESQDLEKFTKFSEDILELKKEVDTEDELKKKYPDCNVNELLDARRNYLNKLDNLLAKRQDEFLEKYPDSKTLEKDLDAIIKDNNEKFQDFVARRNPRINPKDVDCKTIISDELDEILGKLWRLIQILAPIALIFFGSVDFGKAVISEDNDALKKATSDFIKRAIATLIIFFLPFLIKLTFNIFGRMESGQSIEYCLFSSIQVKDVRING